VIGAVRDGLIDIAINIVTDFFTDTVKTAVDCPLNGKVNDKIVRRKIIR
jgi:hypothetical protein